mgnify:CR=1 FL=1|tara:strand:+ start:819 stop:1214 length:396 start_codon:yes stop_codon:yes gene_type:complete
MKKVRGYIFSRAFMGERAPQHVQNIIIRDFCKKNSLNYLLSATEYKMKNSFLILKDIVSNMKDFDGIVAYSLFQLPANYNERNKILKKIIKKKKFIFFAVEQAKVSTLKDLNNINSIWEIKKTLPFCPNQI